MIDLGSQWGLLTILAPIILGIAIAWAMLHNRGSKREVEQTEDATRRMYDNQNAQDQARDAE